MAEDGTQRLAFNKRRLLPLSYISDYTPHPNTQSLKQDPCSYGTLKGWRVKPRVGPVEAKGSEMLA